MATEGSTSMLGSAGEEKPANGATGAEVPITTENEKPAEGAAAEVKADGADGKPPAEVKPAEKVEDKPVLVDDTWKPADVEGVKRDDAQLGEFRAAAKELGLTTKQAQALVGLSDKFEKARSEANLKGLEQTAQEFAAEGRKAVETDAEYGGQKFEATLAAAQRAVRELGKKHGLADRLKQLGMDNDPVLTKVFADIGRMMGEDKLIDGAKGQGRPSASEQFLQSAYPTMFGGEKPGRKAPTKE